MYACTPHIANFNMGHLGSLVIVTCILRGNGDSEVSSSLGQF
jgi:hypothetical protein